MAKRQKHGAAMNGRPRSWAWLHNTRDQWLRLREVSDDVDVLENTWEEWWAMKQETVVLLRRQGLRVYDEPVDVPGARTTY